MRRALPFLVATLYTPGEAVLDGSSPSHGPPRHAPSRKISNGSPTLRTDLMLYDKPASAFEVKHRGSKYELAIVAG